MPLSPAIEGLATSFREAKAAAQAQGISQAVFIEEMFRKNLLLSAASEFEHRITTSILQHVDAVASDCDCVVALVKHKAVARQYHTFFEWDKQSLGPFSRLLGETIGSVLKREEKASPTKENTEAFLEIGSLRNQLVHKNFVAFSCEKSSEEIVALCEKAEEFVRRVEALLQPPALAGHLEVAAATAPVNAVAAEPGGAPRTDTGTENSQPGLPPAAR